MNLDNRITQPENIHDQISPEKRLSKLWEKISHTLWIKFDDLKNILSFSTIQSLEDIKKELRSLSEKSDSKTQLSKEYIDTLANEFYTLSIELQSKSKEARQNLFKELGKDEVDTLISQSFIAKKLPQNLLYRSINPKNLSDEITGFSLGSIRSAEILWNTVFQLVFGAIKAPVDIYKLIAKWDEYEYKMPNI